MELKLFDIVNLMMIFQLSIFTYFLIDKGRNHLSNRILAIFFITQIIGLSDTLIASLYPDFYAVTPFLTIIGSPVRFLWAPLMYIYVKSLVYTDFSLKGIHLLHMIPFFAIALILIINYYIRDVATVSHFPEEGGRLSALWGISARYLLYLHVMIYNSLSLITLEKFKNEIKNKIAAVESIKFSWLKFILYGYIVASITNIILHIPAAKIDPSTGNLLTFIAFLVFFTTLFYKALINPDLFLGTEENPKYKSSPLAERDAKLIMKKLDQFMQINQPFLDPSITVKQLADKLAVSDRVLSQTINEYRKQNFYDFINNYRINFAKNLLNNPVDDKMTVLEILYEAGFNSKSAFNVAFKKETGVTPSQFRRLNELEINVN
ncbi:MAG: AraC family transcriptional regulator [Cyclobacteriaceae bacterium]|nr:AraC family transcriptional regulator [Cyclobacteriaceae bacterium]